MINSNLIYVLLSPLTQNKAELESAGDDIVDNSIWRAGANWHENSKKRKIEKTIRSKNCFRTPKQLGDNCIVFEDLPASIVDLMVGNGVYGRLSNHQLMPTNLQIHYGYPHSNATEKTKLTDYNFNVLFTGNNVFLVLTFEVDGGHEIINLIQSELTLQQEFY